MVCSNTFQKINTSLTTDLSAVVHHYSLPTYDSRPVAVYTPSVFLILSAFYTTSHSVTVQPRITLPAKNEQSVLIFRIFIMSDKRSECPVGSLMDFSGN